MNATETTIINGRTYTVERVDNRLYPHAVEQGFDGYAYWLIGKRGARKLAYWSVQTGHYVIIAA